MSVSPLMLVRTDSTNVMYDPYLKKVGVNLSPLGRERRLKKWRINLINECNKYHDNELIEYYNNTRLNYKNRVKL